MKKSFLIGLLATLLLAGGLFTAYLLSGARAPSKAPNMKALFFGNPLLDLIKETTPDYLTKKGVAKKYLNSETFAVNSDDYSNHQSPFYNQGVANIFADFKDNPDGIMKVAGGASQNSARVTAYMLKALKQKAEVTFTGAVGMDDEAKCLRDSCAECDVKTMYQEVQGQSTGKCAACFYENETGEAQRTLSPCLNAACKFDSSKITDAILKEYELFYAEGFFIDHSLDALKTVGQHAKTNHKQFVLNISSKCPDAVNKEKFMELVPFATVIFGNEEEFISLIGHYNTVVKRNSEFNAMESDFQKMFETFANELPTQTFIVTRGTKNAFVMNNKNLSEHQIYNFINEPTIMDVVAAGDAFVGGYLAGMITRKTLEESMKLAALGAGLIVQRRGCSFPEQEHDFNSIYGNLNIFVQDKKNLMKDFKFVELTKKVTAASADPQPEK